jgi:hypothetical protein
VAADLFKLAWQTDNNTAWILIAVAPTWLQVVSNSGSVVITNVLDEDNMASDSATALATQQSIKAYVDNNIPVANIDRPAGSWNYPTSNPAPLDTDSGTNGTIKRQLFDDTTEEFVQSVFQVPSDVASGTVTFEAWGYATTADGNEIQLRLGHVPLADSENWDTAYTDVDSGDLTTDGTQDDLDYFTWTETIANLGWGASEFVRIQLSRIAIDDGSALSGDWGLVHFRIRIPRI